jgi:hypothetical protein
LDPLQRVLIGIQGDDDLAFGSVIVSFLKKSGGLLPGGARRLNQITDRAIEVAYDDMKKFMNVGVAKPAGITLPAASVPAGTVPAALPAHGFAAPQAPKTTP